MIELEEAKRQLGELVTSKRLILFAGSGISIDSGLPTWEGFLDHFIQFCRELAKQYRGCEIQQVFQPDLFKSAEDEKKKNPVHVATVLKNKISTLPQNIRTNIENDFKKWFYGVFASAKPNKNHELIVGTAYPYILTSNYDLLLEDAQKSLGSPYSSLSFHQKELIAEALYMRNPAIIHVHGQFSDVVLNKIVLTSEDYARLIKKGVPGFSFAIQSLFLSHSALFVGYGASDPHLEDLVEEFSYFFDFHTGPNISKNFLEITRSRVGRILDDYKKRMRTELVVIDTFEQYQELLGHLQSCAPLQYNLGI